MLRKYWILFLIFSILGTGFLFSMDFVNILQTFESLIFETSVFVKDVPVLTTTAQLLDFFNKLGAVQMGFTLNIPMDLELLRGILFIYVIDGLEGH